MDTSRRVLVLGATTNPDRYAYKAAERLTDNGFKVVPVGIRKGELFGEVIVTDKSIQTDIDTITLYVGPERQLEWYNYILETNPKRVIFNPGTENSELQQQLISKGIEVEEACTLVLLSMQSF